MVGGVDTRNDGDRGEGERGNLPLLTTRLVGREQTLRELPLVLRETRLLTLCGPGGAGKTRLAAALADAMREDFVGGVWWVDLSASANPQLVAQAVGTALLPAEPVREHGFAAIAERLTEPSLLVLDNCEQVADGCAELLVGLLARSQTVRVIATSRQPLGVAGERVWRVEGLEVSLNAPGEDDAVALFAQRVREAGGSLELERPEVRAAVTRICTALDGLPLALELAAARARLLGIVQIADRLRSDTDFLRHPGRGVPERQRTLRQTLDWSHELLTDAERVLFRRLAVFRGDFSLPAVEAICGAEEPDDLALLDVLAALTDQSLVQVLEDRVSPRYRLPETIHRYAARRLDESGEREAIAARHAAHFAALARDESGGPDSLRWLDLIEFEHDNFREAMNWLLEHEPEQAAGLALRIWPFLRQRGHYHEARLWFESLLALESALAEPVRARALLEAAEVELLECDYLSATARLRETLRLAARPEDQEIRALALQRLGSIAREQGRYEEARELHGESLAAWTALGDRHGMATSRDYLGFVAWLVGDCAAADALCTQALAEFRRSGAAQQIVQALVNLGATALYSGNPPAARERLSEALAISRRIGFQEGIAWSQHELAILARDARGPLAERAQMLRDALLVHHRLGDRWRLASVLEEIAGSLLSRANPGGAAELLAFAEQLRERLQAPIPPVERPYRDTAREGLRSQLGPDAHAAAGARALRLSLDAAVGLATEAIDELTRGCAVQGTPILTARELAVLELLTRGDTNREIASALYISPSTAGVHVSNILRKLGAKRRVDAAALAHRHGLLAVR